MKSNIPKGLMILSIFLMISCVFSIRYLLRPDANMIFLGHILSGLSFKLYYAGLLSINFIIAIGLLFRHRWSYVGYFIISAWGIFGAIINVFFTTNDMLLESGWKLVDNLPSFQMVQWLIVVVVLLMAFWLFCYRSQFWSVKKKYDLPTKHWCRTQNLGSTVQN